MYYDYICDDILETATKDAYTGRVGNPNDPKKNHIVFMEQGGAYFNLFEMGIPYESAKRRTPVEMHSFVKHIKQKFGIRDEDMPSFWEHLAKKVLWVYDDLPYMQ